MAGVDVGVAADVDLDWSQLAGAAAHDLVPRPERAERPLLRAVRRGRRPRRATRRSSCGRRRSARRSRVLVVLPDEHLAGLQLPGRGRQRLRRHVVRRAAEPDASISSRTYIARGVPPRFYRYDLPFLHWLYWSGKSAEFISDSDFDLIAKRRRPRARLRPRRLRGARGVRDDARVRRRHSATATSAAT